jgi:phosphoribosylformylglycinamidine (FGAM) synthase PurS component
VAHRIEIGLKKEIRDPLGGKIRRRVQNDLRLPVESVRTLAVLTLDIELSQEELEMIATGPLVGLGGKKIVEANIDHLKEAWQKPSRF